MSKPKRIQRKRTKGWRMPEGAVYVGRPTRWGNPFRVVAYSQTRVGDPFSLGDRYYDGRPVLDVQEQAVLRYRNWLTTGLLFQMTNCLPPKTAPIAPSHVGFYGNGYPSPDRHTVTYDPPDLSWEQLAGHDLACWCPLDQPCHADVLLEIANTKQEATS